jgi:hypothetical protein
MTLMHSSADVELITGEADVELITGEVRALVRYVRETCTCAREELLRCEIISKSLKSLIPKAGTKSIPFPALMKISLYLK